MALEIEESCHTLFRGVPEAGFGRLVICPSLIDEEPPANRVGSTQTG
jgi:hypothetical protein